THLIEVDAHRRVGSALLHLGTIEVVERVEGYQRKESLTGASRGSHPLDQPPSSLVTRAIWYTVPPELLEAADVAAELVPSALHASEHAAIGMLPLFAICDRWDVGGVS